MLEQIKRLLRALEEPGRRQPAADDPRVAAAALLVHVAEADGAFTQAECERLRALLQDEFGIGEAEASELLAKGRQADADAIEQVRALTGGGADFAFEMAGSVRALEAAWKMTRRGGTTVTAGLPPPDAALAVNVVSLVGEERTLKGSYIGTCVPSRDIPRYVALYRDGRLPVDRLLSGTIDLQDINAGFDRLAAGEVVRLVVRP